MGRFSDDSIAYVEAVAGAPAGADLRFYEAPRPWRNPRVRLASRYQSGHKSRSRHAAARHGYPSLQLSLLPISVAPISPRPPAELDSVLTDAHAAYHALVHACDSQTAVTV